MKESYHINVGMLQQAPEEKRKQYREPIKTAASRIAEVKSSLAQGKFLTGEEYGDIWNLFDKLSVDLDILLDQFSADLMFD